VGPDSRLRGNDKIEYGNDKVECGNVNKEGWDDREKELMTLTHPQIFRFTQNDRPDGI
jgi:hypothetical protein